MTARAYAVPLADYERVTAQRDVADARCERALTSLRSLVRQLERIQGYSTHTEQTELRDARALLVEAGR